MAMQIGLLIYGSPDTISGGYLYDRQLAQALRRAGHGVEIVSLPWRNYGRHLADNFSPALLARLRHGAFDLLLQDELNHPSLAWLNGRLRREVTYPLVTIVHHLRSSERHPRLLLPLYRWVEERYLNSVDGLIFNSQTTRAIATARLRTPKPHVVAYPAADHREPPATAEVADAIRQRTFATGPLHLLFVGNVIPRKGLHTLLQALAETPRPLWHLHVAGNLATDRAYAAQVRRLIGAAGLNEHVTLYGVCTDETIRALYWRCHLYAAPAYEGFGISYLEAMSFGLPVIASTAGAAHEIVTPGVDGYLVAPDDTATLATRITTLCRDRGLLAALACAARQRYDRHPTWQASFAPALEWLGALPTSRATMLSC